jgi:hypothetical protein
MRISQVDHNYRYPKYHNVSNRSIFSDMLEKSPDFKTSRKPKETAKIAQINTRPYQKQEQDFF